MLAARAEQSLSPWTDVLSDFALCRMGAEGGATRSDLVRDLGPFVGHRLSPSEFRQNLDETLDTLVAGGLASEARGRYQLSERGRSQATQWLQTKELERDWGLIRDLQMTARALDMQGEPATRRRMLQRPDGLRMAIVQQAFNLKIRRIPTLARVRAALAGVALKRAFGEKLTPEYAIDGAIDAAASRVLAGHLAHRPRDFDTDSRLIAALAAEAVGAAQSDPGTLRLILLRQYVTRAVSGPASDDKHGRETSVVRAIAAQSARPDLAQFCAAVRNAADAVAQGWPGNRKAFISHVWSVIGERHADWGLTEIEFKSMLVEAHRSGQVMLANADLKNRTDLADFQRSAVTYKNTVWHFVRLEA